MSATTKKQTLDCIIPLLTEIRTGLGNYWTFYEEGIDGVLDAAAKQQDTTAWFEQLQHLVEGFDKVRFSHEGVLFLFQDMGIHAPKPQIWGEGEGAAFAWPPPRTAALSTQHEQHKQEKQPVILRDNVLPFNFSEAVQPGLTFPKDFRAYHCPRDEIIMTKNYVHPPPNPLRRTSDNPVFFSNLALKANIGELFGYTVRIEKNSQRSDSITWQAPPTLSYDPEDDDLLAWKKRSEGYADDKGNEIEAPIAGTDTLPLWTCLDLEM